MSTANVYSNDANTLGNLNGLFKNTYADKLQELIPDGVKIMNLIKFQSKDKMPGNNFNQPVILGLEHGITFASSDEDAFNLLPAIAGQIKNATIKGSPVVLRSVLGYSAASRAAQGGAQSFMDATKFLVANMLRSMAKKLEIEMLYGQEGYAKANGAMSGTALTIQTAEWAPGIWAGAEGLPIEIRDSTGATIRGESTVVSVDMDTRVVTLQSNIANVISGDVVWHKGAYGNEFIGIHKVLTTSGSLFGINNSTYNLFKGNQFSASSAALSFNKLNLAAARAVEKGLEGKLVCLINVRAWANMLNDQAALRKYDSSYSKTKLENGSEALTFYAQNGELQIVPSIYVKEGYAYMLSVDEWSRIGSTDMTFKRPGQGEQFFRDLDSAAGYELRLYSDQAIFCSAPGRNVLITSIVNSAT